MTKLPETDVKQGCNKAQFIPLNGNLAQITYTHRANEGN